MKPLVSIIIPSYNARPWVCEAVDSVLAQTYPDYEIIVVDDGSTDGSGELLRQRYGKQIRYVYQVNRGLSGARNTGLDHADGAYIQFLDADDLLLPEKLERQVAFLEDHPEIGIVYSGCLCFYESQPEKHFPSPRQSRYCSGHILAQMVEGGFIRPHMPLVRRSCINRVGRFKEYLTSAEDYDFWLRTARAGILFHYLGGEPLVLYRVRSDSMSAARVNHARNTIQVLNELRVDIGSDAECRRLGLPDAIARWHFALGVALAEEGHLWPGWREIARALLQSRHQGAAKLVYLIFLLAVGPDRVRLLLQQLGAARRRARLILGEAGG